MEEIRKGIEYKLHNFNSEEGQTVVFVEKIDDGFLPGTTNEEVINMMVDRFYALQERKFSVENQCIIIFLKNIRSLLAKRLSRKIKKLKEYSNE